MATNNAELPVEIANSMGKLVSAIEELLKDVLSRPASESERAEIVLAMNKMSQKFRFATSPRRKRAKASIPSAVGLLGSILHPQRQLKPKAKKNSKHGPAQGKGVEKCAPASKGQA